MYPIQFGYEKCKPSQLISLTTYDNYLFHYVVDGSGRVYVNSLDRKTTINKNQGFLITPGTTSSYKADMENPWSYYWIEFNGIKAKNYMNNAGLTKEHYHFKSNKNNQTFNLISIFESILDENNQHEPFVIGQLYFLINELIQNSEHHIDNEIHKINNIYIKEAIIFIANNYQHDLSVSEIAKHCNISRTHLSRLFNEELATSPSQYLIKFRLNKASELLKNNTLSIKDIAEEVGYSNQFNFSTAFKNKFGISPMQWRHQNS